MLPGCQVCLMAYLCLCLAGIHNLTITSKELQQSPSDGCRWRVCSSSASQGHHPATSQSEDATTASADAAVLDTDNLRLLGREIRNISLLSPSLIDLAPEYQVDFAVARQGSSSILHRKMLCVHI